MISIKVLLEILQRENTNPDVLNENGDAPLHSIVKSKRQDKVELLVTLFTHSTTNVNMQVANGMTALHFAAQVSHIVIYNCVYRSTHTCVHVNL